MEAVGLIEVIGLVAAIEGADQGVKSANVHMLGMWKVGANIVTIAFGGDVGAVSAAVEAGGQAAARVGQVRTTHVIARMQPKVWQLLEHKQQKPEQPKATVSKSTTRKQAPNDVEQLSSVPTQTTHDAQTQLLPSVPTVQSMGATSVEKQPTERKSRRSQRVTKEEGQ